MHLLKKETFAETLDAASPFIFGLNLLVYVPGPLLSQSQSASFSNLDTENLFCLLFQMH